MVGDELMQFNKYASLILTTMAGITIMSNHDYKIFISITLIVVAGLWVNDTLFEEVKK